VAVTVIEPLLCPVVGADWVVLIDIVNPTQGSVGVTVSFLQLMIIKVAAKNSIETSVIFFIFFDLFKNIYFFLFSNKNMLHFPS
jgi:hypothetical protein